MSMSEHDAAIIGPSLVAFLPGLSGAQKNHVKLALALAEMATETAHQEGLVEDWFAYYRNQLRFMGWDAVSGQPEGARKQRTDKALQTIAATAGERFADRLEVCLQRLLSNPGILGGLELRARQKQHLQLLPCAPAGQHRVDMVLYHEAGSADVFRAGFLSRVRSSVQVRAELVRFNILAFENSHLPKVQRRVIENSLQRISEHDI